jgi:hypothetical protein
MSQIMQDYRDRIEQLQKYREMLLENYEILPDAAYQVFSVEAEIRSYELRSDKLNISIQSVKCNMCEQGISDFEVPVRIGEKGRYLICPRCINTIHQIKGTSEFEETFAISSAGTVKQDCDGPLKPLQKESLLRKSGKCWLIHDVVDDLFYKAGRRKHNLLTSWIDEIVNRLYLLNEQKRVLDELRAAIPDVYRQLQSIEAQILDHQSKLERIRGGKLPYRCSQCGSWLKQEGVPTFFGTYTICAGCKKIIEGVMTLPEAEKRFELTAGTLRRDNSRGQLEGYKASGLLRLSGSIWLIHEVVILDKYRELKVEAPAPAPTSVPSDLLQRSASIFNRVMATK